MPNFYSTQYSLGQSLGQNQKIYCWLYIVFTFVILYQQPTTSSTFSDTITLYIKERAYFVIKKYGKLYCIDY